MPEKITTWNRLWSMPEKYIKAHLEFARSIHPDGRTDAYRAKNRAIHSRRKAKPTA